MIPTDARWPPNLAERLGAAAPRQPWLIGNPTLLAALSQNRLLLLSPFEKTPRRVTADSARRRNELVAALADWAFIAYCTPGG